MQQLTHAHSGLGRTWLQIEPSSLLSSHPLPIWLNAAVVRGQKGIAIASWPVLFMTGPSLCHDESIGKKRKRYLNRSRGVLAECRAVSLGENKTALPPHWVNDAVHIHLTTDYNDHRSHFPCLNDPITPTATEINFLNNIPREHWLDMLTLPADLN